MIGEIIQAIINECKSLNEGKKGTFMLKTDFNVSELASYEMPLLIFELVDAPESGQFLGGGSFLNWIFALNSYNYQPNASAEDDGGYSSALLNVVDDVRRYFSKANWATDEMKAAVINYGLKLTLSGIAPADALPKEDGLVLGYKIVFDSMAIDIETNSIVDSTSVLEIVEQIDYPPID